jgi:hypothetical protein
MISACHHRLRARETGVRFPVGESLFFAVPLHIQVLRIVAEPCFLWLRKLEMGTDMK